MTFFWRNTCTSYIFSVLPIGLLVTRFTLRFRVHGRNERDGALTETCQCAGCLKILGFNMCFNLLIWFLVFNMKFNMIWAHTMAVLKANMMIHQQTFRRPMGERPSFHWFICRCWQEDLWWKLVTPFCHWIFSVDWIVTCVWYWGIPR